MAFVEAKNFVLSKTLQGLLLIAAGIFLKFLETKGITFLGSGQDLVEVLLQLIGFVWAIVGRFQATKKLSI